tara:strand:- start:2896 stop:3891 length:996 start_codon:yes stop_codon:yes gene_type:complete
MRRPRFWNDTSFLTNLLTPIGLIHHFISKQSYKLQKPYHSKAPVICIGSPIIGGGGKTPVAIAIQELLLKKNKKISATSKCYKGKIKRPTLINEKHTSLDVGDEPILLSHYCETFVSKNRKSALKMANNHNKYDYIVSDDGYRDVSIKNKVNVLVIDGNMPRINLKQFPAGDLHGSIDYALGIADILILIDEEKTDKKIIEKIKNYKIQNVSAKSEYRIRNDDKSEKIAFTGIGMPKKFYNTLRKLKIKTTQNLTYPNHFQYSRNDVKQLLEIATAHGKYSLLTTSKDYVRFNDENDPNKQLRDLVDVLDITIKIDHPDDLMKYITQKSMN